MRIVNACIHSNACRRKVFFLFAILCICLIESIHAGPIKPIKPIIPDNDDSAIGDDGTGCVSGCTLHTEPPTRSPSQKPVSAVVSFIMSEVEFDKFTLVYGPLDHPFDKSELGELEKETEGHITSIFNVLYQNRLSKVDLLVNGAFTRNYVDERALQESQEQILIYSGAGNIFSLVEVSSGEAREILLAAFSGNAATKYVNSVNKKLSSNITALEVIEVAEPSVAPSNAPFLEATATPSSSSSGTIVPIAVVAGIAAAAAASSSSSAAAAASSAGSPSSVADNSIKSSNKTADAEAEARKQMSGRNTKKTTGRLSTRNKKFYSKFRKHLESDEEEEDDDLPKNHIESDSDKFEGAEKVDLELGYEVDIA